MPKSISRLFIVTPLPKWQRGLPNIYEVSEKVMTRYECSVCGMPFGDKGKAHNNCYEPDSYPSRRIRVKIIHRTERTWP